MLIINKVKLTEYILQYRWKYEAGYDYLDNDSINVRGFGRLEKMKIPDDKRYEIYFRRIPKGKKRDQLICFYFDNEGVLSSIKADSFDDDDLKEIVDNAIWELQFIHFIKNERITCADGAKMDGEEQNDEQND